MEKSIPMNIAIVNSEDINGGAARAAYRLHRRLLDANINSTMLVQKKMSDDSTVIGPETKLRKFWAQVRPNLDALPLKFYPRKTKTPFSVSWLGFSNIADQINEINPDIVHLHWICGGMLRIEDLSKIKAPIVWSLHDMWAFTGGCHYDEECGAYKNSCGQCRVLNSHRKNDLSRYIFRRKKRTFAHIDNFTIVGLSSWLAKSAKESSLLRDKRVVNLPNPIDTDLFKPFDKNLSRELWHLPKDKKLILFGAMGATSDPRKGFKELSDALRKLDHEEMIELIVFGSSEPQNAPEFGFKTHYLGQLHDDISLVTLYNAVDMMIVPSLQENLSNAIMESLACATPVVGFDIGGNSDLIEHKKNGYLAKPFDTTALKEGIEWLLHCENYENICQNAREKVLKEFDSKMVTRKYIELYEEILSD